MIAVPFTGSLSTAVQVQTGSGVWANGIRLLKPAAPAVSKIVPFVRPAAPLITGALAGKAALLVGAFAAGYALGEQINKLLLDPSQPQLKPLPTGKPIPTTVEVPYTPGVKHNYAVTFEQTSIYQPRYNCGSNTFQGQNNGGVEQRTFELNNKYGLRVLTDVAKAQYVCGEGEDGGWISVRQIEFADKDGDWDSCCSAPGSVGFRYRSFYQNEPDVIYNRIVEILKDGVPLPLPKQDDAPEPEPLPEVLPQVAPKRVLPKTPVIAPPIPAPGEPVPEPLTQPNPTKIPTQVPVRTAPAVVPQQQPKGVPMPVSGAWPPPAPPITVKPTPPGQHIIGDGTTVNTGGTRPSIEAVAAEVGRIEQKSAQTFNKAGDILQGLGDLADIIELINFIKDLLEQPLPSKSYSITGICEAANEDGEQPATTVILPKEMWAERVISSIDMLPDLLQAHLGYKTPICSSNDKPVLEGDFRTVSFRSDEVSPYGKSRLRKRFRYRSTSSIGLAGVVDHWKDFTFNAGSVCVQHAGSSWGTPQVWAATADEGKRVIRHAAREAGIDPDQNGRWIVGGSNSSRVGVSGTMRVDTKGGYYWITARDGSNARPIVALT